MLRKDSYEIDAPKYRNKADGISATRCLTFSMPYGNYLFGPIKKIH